MPEREALLALAELDALSEIWAVETKLQATCESLCEDRPDRLPVPLAERIEALCRLSFEEGAYRAALARAGEA